MIRCVHFVAEKGVCRHNDVVRGLNSEVSCPRLSPVCSSGLDFDPELGFRG